MLVRVVLQLYQTLIALGLILQIAFFIALAVVIYLVWRDRMRHEIETWSTRSRRVIDGSAPRSSWPTSRSRSGQTACRSCGYPAIAFLLVLVICGFSMWRVWRDERTYGM